MRTYHAAVEHGERYWLVYVPEVDRWTQARHLREVEEVARDLVAVMDEVPADSFALAVDIQLPTAVRRHLDHAQRLREEAASANARAAEESRAAARDLAGQGIPLRDVGKLLGVSYQRAHQLVSS